MVLVDQLLDLIHRAEYVVYTRHSSSDRVREKEVSIWVYFSSSVCCNSLQPILLQSNKGPTVFVSSAIFEVIISYSPLNLLVTSRPALVFIHDFFIREVVVIHFFVDDF